MGDLLHFTKFESFLKIIHSNKLRYGLLYNCNDPLEKRVITDEHIHSIPQEYRREVVENGKFLSYEVDDDLIAKSFGRFERYYKESLRLLCFVESDNPSSHPRMWAQYGDNYQGVCLSFDKEKLLSGVADNHHIYNVDYDAPMSEINKFMQSTRISKEQFRDNYNEGFSDSFISNYIEDILSNPLTPYRFKHSDWSDENETRIIGVMPEDTYLDIRDSLNGIIITGYSNFDKELLEGLLPKVYRGNKLVRRVSFQPGMKEGGILL